MPIDIKLNLLSLHPAKTGGTTLATILGWLNLPLEKRKEYLVGWDDNNNPNVFFGYITFMLF